MKPYTFTFWVRGSCGPDRYLLKSEASSKTDAAKRGRAYAKAQGIRFMEAVEGHNVTPSVNDALEIPPRAGAITSKAAA